jgi:oligoendopeptidase F
MADVTEILNRATAAITNFYGAKAVVDGHDEAVANLQSQIDQLNAELPTKQAEVDAAVTEVKAVYAEILGNL